MRNEQEMMDLILSTAREDERIRAVYMNGSRTNPNAVKDIFQDFDIVYVVRETESFQQDTAWIDRFGVRLFMQYPEDSGDYPSDKHNCNGWLIQFADGNRLDLHVQRVEFSQKNILRDRLGIILLDKDNCLPEMPPSTDADFFVIRPTENQFLDTYNEFWWRLNNVAKGLWRKEIPYAKGHDVLSTQSAAQSPLLEGRSWHGFFLYRKKRKIALPVCTKRGLGGLSRHLFPGRPCGVLAGGGVDVPAVPQHCQTGGTGPWIPLQGRRGCCKLSVFPSFQETPCRCSGIF